MKKVLQKNIINITSEYRDGLKEIFQDDLDSVIIYGSQARGESTDESDIDILCVMKKPFNYGELILKTAKISADISLKHDVVISTAFVTVDEFRTKNTPFLKNVRKEAQVV